MYADLIAEMTCRKNNPIRRAIKLNRCANFCVVNNTRQICHSFDKCSILLTPILIKLLSLEGVPTPKCKLPGSLAKFIVERDDGWESQRIERSGASFYSEIGNISLFVKCDREIAVCLFSSLERILKKSPWLRPNREAYVLISMRDNAFSEALEWIHGYPLLGGATFGRSLIFLSDVNVRQLERCGVLDMALAHELFHVKIADYSLYLPKWLEEGMAEWISMYHKGSFYREPEIILSENDLELIFNYIQAGHWQLECDPLIDLRSRTIARVTVRKFVMWLSVRFGTQLLLQSAQAASLACPWENHFFRNSGCTIESCWGLYSSHYLS